MRSASWALSHSASTSFKPSCRMASEPVPMLSPEYSTSTPCFLSVMRSSAISSRLRIIRATL